MPVLRAAARHGCSRQFGVRTVARMDIPAELHAVAVLCLQWFEVADSGQSAT